MPLNRDHDGDFIPGWVLRSGPSRAPAKRLLEPLIPGGSLASWLEVQAGTASYVTTGSNVDIANCTIATAATSGSGARLRTSFDIRPERYNDIVWTIYGLRCNTDDGFDLWYEIGNTSGTAGVGLRHNNGLATEDQAHAKLYSYNTAQTIHDTQVDLLKGAFGKSRKPKNITMWFQPKRNEVHILQDDQVLDSRSIAGEWGVGGIRPMVTMTTREAVAHSFTFYAAELILG